jgi:hypothetical protein
MTNNDRDTVYTNNNTERSVYTRDSNGTGWFVGIIVALALLAIGYLVFSANSGSSTATTTNNSPAIEAPSPAPMTEAPATGAPATDAAPAGDAATPAAPAAPAAE